MSDMKEVRARITRLDMTQRQVARVAGVEETKFSRWLSGDREPPAWFTEKVGCVLDALEEAERAAKAARRQVMDVLDEAERAADAARRKVMARAGLAS